MKKKKTNETLHITFINPNTGDELAKTLVKIIAEQLVENVISKNIAQNSAVN